MNPVGTGTPRVEINLIDQTRNTSSGLRGVVAVLGITQRGEVNKPVLIRSWSDFTKNFGGLVSYSQFPLYCLRALERGGVLMVNRIAHYTDLTDPDTIVGGKATITITESSNDVAVTARDHGTWGNGVTVTISSAASGITAKVDIRVDISGYPELTQFLRDQPLAPTAAELTTLNTASNFVTFGTPTNQLPIGSATLAAGSEDYSGVVDADYVGTAASATGLHAFDNSKEPVRICVPEQYDNDIDQALITYVVARKDMRAILRSPNNITGSEAEAYRDATGNYSSGTAVDSWYGSMVFGDITITDPRDSLSKDIHVIGDVIGAMSAKDNTDDRYLATFGTKRGRIYNNQGVVYNLGIPARRDESDSLIIKGVNPVIDNAEYGAVYWGNRTLQRENTQLKQENVADMIVTLFRDLKPLLESELGEPNDIETWKTIYRKVSQHMDTVVQARAIFEYVYDGDQNIDDVADAQINSADDIAAGTYRFRLFIKPISALQYVSLDITVSKSDVDFEIINN